MFHTTFDFTDPNQILIFTVVLLVIQTVFNVVGVNFLGRISQIGVYVEILGTFGIAIMLGVTGFHHGFDYLFSTQGTENVASNPYGVDFGGNWWLGAALVAILAHVYIFYGFESAGDVAEEVVQASRRVPRAIISSLLTAGITSFILVGALILAIPSGANGLTQVVQGGVPAIIAGVRIATVTTIGLVTVTALIGEGGLGSLIYDGLLHDFHTPLVVGTVLSVALAVVADLGLAGAQRIITPWARTRVTA